MARDAPHTLNWSHKPCAACSAISGPNAGQYLVVICGYVTSVLGSHSTKGRHVVLRMRVIFFEDAKRKLLSRPCKVALATRSGF